MNSNGMIIATDHRDALGGIERIEYEWEGGNVVHISARLLDLITIAKLKPGFRFNIGPFKLMMVDYEPWMRGIIAVRRGVRGQWLYSLYHATRWVEIVYRRLIITLAVWHLARYNEAAVPVWRDVFVLNKLARMLGR